MPVPDPPPFAPPIPLGLLARGQWAEVTDLVGAPDFIHRLEELGLRRGTCVEMVQSGSPYIIRLAGNKLCIRDGDVFGVLVQRRHSA